MRLNRRNVVLSAASAVVPTRLSATGHTKQTDFACQLFHVRRFGAIGDGESHPLFTRFRNLKEAQREFPRAISLMQELDTCALQAAVDAAEAAGGGIVTVDTGIFMINGTVVFPESRQGLGEGPNGGVSLAGAGQGATVFKVVRDFPGYIFTCANRLDTRWGSQGFWQDFSLFGPGKDPGWGRFACQVGGLEWSARRVVSRVTVQNCRVGLSITGDQALIDRVSAFSCTYGIYFDKPNPALFGDLLFEKIILDGSWRAAVGVHPDATIPKSLWLSCIFSASPFGIYKEFGGSSQFAARSVHLMHHQFENIGLAAISGGNASGLDIGTRPDTQNLRLTMSQFGPWSDQRRISGWTRNAMLDLGECHQGLMIDGINDPNLWLPGESALMRFGYPESLTIFGDIEALLLSCRQSNRPFLVMKSRSDDIVVQHIGRWTGRVYQMDVNQQIKAGDVLVHYRGNVVPSSGVLTEQIAGVCMSSSSSSYDAIVVATAGQVSVNAAQIEESGTIVYAGKYGKAVSTATGPRIGWAYGTGGDQARVRLAGID